MSPQPTGADSDELTRAGAAEVIGHAETGDRAAGRVWNRAIDALALALATYTAVLSPKRVVIGGGLSLAGDALLLPLREAVARRLPWRPPPSIVRSRLGDTAGLLGAALLADESIARAARVHAEGSRDLPR